MSNAKLLAEWFWIERWDGSPAAGLPLLARGLYREMLTRAWRLGGWLPADHSAIQRLVRVTPAEWRKAWPLVAPYWHQEGDRLTNDTQLEVMEEMRRRKAAASEHGRGAAGMRWARREHGAGNTRAQPEHKPPSPSPSPTEERTNERHTPANPLVAGRRPALESECLKLVGEIAPAEDKDPEEIMRQAAHYEGASRSKLNPASMSDDRLLNTVLDLRAWKAEIEKRGSRSRATTGIV